MQVMAKSHYYLVDTSVIMKGTAVTKLQFIPMSEEPFQVHGLKVRFPAVFFQLLETFNLV